mgnify:CR=1 FL=1
MYRLLPLILLFFALWGCTSNIDDTNKTTTATQTSSGTPSTDPTTEPLSNTSDTTAETTKAPVILGSFSTPILDDNENRTGNIKIACRAIYGTVIKPGKEFSFNSVVGDRTESKGYKEAHAFVNGEEVNEIGGGICQVASTIFNAATEAGFEITERHQHPEEVYYVELGKDATVSSDLDFKFKNTGSSDIMLKTYVDDGKVFAEILEKE